MAIPRIQDLADPRFDPYRADEDLFAGHLDPYATIEQMRARGLVVQESYRQFTDLPQQPIDPAKPRYCVLSYAAVEEVMSKPEVFSNQ